MLVPRIVLLIGLGLAAAAHGQAQGGDPRIDALNARYGGAVSFRMNGHLLIIDRRDAEGRYRREQAPLQAIDPGSIGYSLQADAVTARCARDMSACFTQEDYRAGIVKRSSLIAIPIAMDDPAGHDLIGLLQQLVAAADERHAETPKPR